MEPLIRGAIGWWNDFIGVNLLILETICWCIDGTNAWLWEGPAHVLKVDCPLFHQGRGDNRWRASRHSLNRESKAPKAKNCRGCRSLISFSLLRRNNTECVSFPKRMTMMTIRICDYIDSIFVRIHVVMFIYLYDARESTRRHWHMFLFYRITA